MRYAGNDRESQSVSPRVLLVSQPSNAGTARHVADLAEGLTRKGLAVTVACPAGGVLSARLIRAAIPVIALPMRREISPLSDLRAFLRLFLLCRRLRPDVLHAHSSKAGFLGRIAGRLAGVPVIAFTPHCWSFQAVEGWKRDFYVGLERLASRFCDVTITVSEEEALEATEAGVVDPGRIRVIPNGLSAGEFEAAPSGARDIPFITVGRLEEQKGYSYLLEAMAELAYHEPGVRLSIVGDGSLRRDLEKQAASLGLRDVVRFEGERADVRPFLRRSRVFVLSSLWEGLPYTIIEAMAARLPVVSTDVGGCRELVIDGETGRLVPARDPAALAAAMRALWRDDALRESMGKAGFQRAVHRFRLESCVDRNEQAYAECLEIARERRSERRRAALLGPKATAVAGTISLVLAGAVVAGGVSLGNRVLPGVRVGGADVGGLTLEQAARVVDELSRRSITVSVSATSAGVAVSGSALRLDVMPALEGAYLVGRVGALPDRVAQGVAAFRGQLSVPVSALSSGAVAEVLADARRRMERAPVDAGFELVGGELKTTQERSGVRVDENAFLTSVGAAATDPRAGDRVVRVTLQQRPPEVTGAEVARLSALAAEWTRRDVVGSAPVGRISLSRARLASLLSVHGGELVVDGPRAAAALAESPLPSSPPENARLAVVNGAVRIIDGVPGSQVDASATARSLQSALESGRGGFAIVLRQREPDVTRSDLAKLGIDRLLSSFTTRFRLGQDGRDININLAATAIRGRVLGVGEVFSLNADTGPRNRGTGYKESLIFSNGKVVPGVGGGVCQVSSTTYQAALRAGLEIVERRSHSMAVSYIAPGLDATTFYPIVDLKFRNTTRGPILVWTAVRGNALTVSIYGSGERPDVRIETTTMKTMPQGTRTVHDVALRPGARVVDSLGTPGYIVASYRVTYQGGRVVTREQLAIDEYRPRNRVVRVGG